MIRKIKWFLLYDVLIHVSQFKWGARLKRRVRMM